MQQSFVPQINVKAQLSPSVLVEMGFNGFPCLLLCLPLNHVVNLSKLTLAQLSVFCRAVNGLKAGTLTVITTPPSASSPGLVPLAV